MKGIRVCLLVILLSSCWRVGPNFKVPKTPSQPSWGELSSDPNILANRPIVSWWQVFNDPNLDQLIMMAKKQNLTLQQAATRIMQARAQLGFAIGELYPQIQQIEGSATKFQLSKYAANVAPIADLNFRSYRMGLQTAWEVDVWGKYRRLVEASSANLTASLSEYDDFLILLLADVSSSYIRIKTIQEQIRIVEQNVEIQARSLAIAKARFDAGVVTELDVQQAKVLLKDTESRLPALQRDLLREKHALTTLLGVTPSCFPTWVLEEDTIPKAPREVALGIPAEMLMQRPDIRRALYDAKRQSALIGVAFSELLPAFSIFGFIGFDSSGSITLSPKQTGGTFLSPGSFTYELGPGFVWKVLNYGRLKNLVRIEDARFQELAIGYQNTVLQAFQEVEDGLAAFIYAQDQEALLKESVEAAERSVSLANTQYVEGDVDYTRVLQTQEALLSSQEQHTLVRGDIALSLVSTYQALGGGWQLRCGQKLLPEPIICEMKQRTDWGCFLDY